MLRSYSAIYRFSFVHDDELAHCIIRILYQEDHFIVFSFQSDIFTANPSPVTYAFSEYKNQFWIANLDECASIFLEDPRDTESTVCNLLELDCSDDEETEELAEVIRFFCINRLHPLPDNDLLHPSSKLNEDFDLPF